MLSLQASPRCCCVLRSSLQGPSRHCQNCTAGGCTLQVPAWFRRVFPATRWGAKLNARITPAFFSWLVSCAAWREGAQGLLALQGCGVMVAHRSKPYEAYHACRLREFRCGSEHLQVGPMEPIDVEVDGIMQRSGVHIRRCR
jgi:hypothetical protein